VIRLLGIVQNQWSQRFGCKHIIAFIWDDEARTEQRPEMLQALRRLRGVDDASFVVLFLDAPKPREKGGSDAWERGRPGPTSPRTRTVGADDATWCRT
jgi:hypothetical protein